MANRKRNRTAARSVAAAPPAETPAKSARFMDEDRAHVTANTLSMGTWLMMADLLNKRVPESTARAFASNAHVILRSSALQERFGAPNSDPNVGKNLILIDRA